MEIAGGKLLLLADDIVQIKTKNKFPGLLGAQPIS